MPDVVLVHGAATTPAVWDQVVTALTDVDVLAPRRPSTGDLQRECDWLESLASEAVVFGMSGGATLVLELAARGRGGAKALIAHEPAAGSLAPAFFAPLAAALAEGGVPAFGSLLYGPSWQLDPRVDPTAVQLDVAMFKTFEPRAPLMPALVTTGELSAPLRHDIGAALGALGYSTRTIPGASHFIAVESPDAVAGLVRDALDRSE